MNTFLGEVLMLCTKFKVRRFSVFSNNDNFPYLDESSRLEKIDSTWVDLSQSAKIDLTRLESVDWTHYSKSIDSTKKILIDTKLIFPWIVLQLFSRKKEWDWLESNFHEKKIKKNIQLNGYSICKLTQIIFQEPYSVFEYIASQKLKII